MKVFSKVWEIAEKLKLVQKLIFKELGTKKIK